MRLDPEFPDAVEPAGLESWVIIGKVAGQEPSTHKFEVIFLSFISLESGRVFCTQNRVGRLLPHAASAARIWSSPDLSRSHDTIVEQQRFGIGPKLPVEVCMLAWFLVDNFAHIN